jgi:hypothetical protein
MTSHTVLSVPWICSDTYWCDLSAALFVKAGRALEQQAGSTVLGRIHWLVRDTVRTRVPQENLYWGCQADVGDRWPT